MMQDKPLVIVGAGWAGKTIASTLVQKDFQKLLGFVDDRKVDGHVLVPNGNEGSPFPVIGHSKDLSEIVKKYGAEGIILAITHHRENHLLSQIVKCHKAGIPIYEMPDLYSKLTRRIPVQHINHQWVLPNLTAPPNNFYIFFYDIVSYLLSLFGLLFVLLPLLPFIALAIKVNSTGSVFFKQKREGKNGKVFTLLKFRTMIHNADHKGAAWTTKDDERITSVGRWLRKFRLDELPQLFNVMKGDMALIGPRPEAVELVQVFKKEIPFYEYRYLVKPGITGWAQVNHENTCSVKGALEKLQYDLYWIKNQSFWLDLKIIFKSVKVMFTGFGAV